MPKKLSPAEWSALVDQIADQYERKRQALESRVKAALLATFFIVRDVKLTSDQSCQIAEAFAVGDYIKCEYLLRQVNL